MHPHAQQPASRCQICLGGAKATKRGSNYREPPAAIQKKERHGSCFLQTVHEARK